MKESVFAEDFLSAPNEGLPLDLAGLSVLRDPTSGAVQSGDTVVVFVTFGTRAHGVLTRCPVQN